MTQPKRLETLFGPVILAWLSCLEIGIWLNGIQPVKVLAHGRKAMSLVRSGGDSLQNAFRWDPKGFSQFLEVLRQPIPAPGTKKTEVFGY